MKKLICILSLSTCLFSIKVYSQETIPGYIKVLTAYFSRYKAIDEVNYTTNFTRKKDGWHIQQLDISKSDSIISDMLFYDVNEHKYLVLDESDYDTTNGQKADEKIEAFFQSNSGASKWYSYDHIRYFGYKGWSYDMIADFGNAVNLSDSMLDGLGRAYAENVTNLLWAGEPLQQGSMDTLSAKLKRLQYPSVPRIKAVKAALDNSIAQFQKLNQSNPSYKTIIGNANLKYFNQNMYGYHTMNFVGDELAAKEYLDRASLADAYILQAKNYLNSCEPNAILFSNGDNDTYQLWYVQQKLNFRKDITVINLSLLGLPICSDWLHKKNMVGFSTPTSFLAEKSSDLAFFLDKPAISKSKEIPSVTKLLNVIYTKMYPFKVPEEKMLYSSFPYKKCFLSFNDLSITGEPSALPPKRMVIDLGKYLLLNDIVMLDIIATNINKRPIQFTGNYYNMFENHLVKTGIVWKLTSKDISLPQQKLDVIQNLEKFIAQKYTPVLNDEPTMISIDGNFSFIDTYITLADFYLEKKDTPTCKHYLQILNAQKASEVGRVAMINLKAGNLNEGKAIFEKLAKNAYQLYLHPNSLERFYSRKSCAEELQFIQATFKTNGIVSSLVDGLVNEIK